MNKLSTVAATLVAPVILMAGQLALASTPDLDRRVAAAEEVLQDLNKIPEQAIPSQLLNRAYAVAVIPNVIKGGFIVGGSYGKGVMLVRRSDGRWSNPAFVTLGNIGVGWQIGAQGSDLILVFKSRQGVDNIERGKFTIGGSASASAGPVGRTAVAATDGEFKAEIYTYARSRGLFAGVSLDGGAITMDHKSNAAFYDGSASGTAARILHDDGIPTPASARPLLDTLTAMAPKLQWQPNGQLAQGSTQGTAPASGQASAPAEETKTYAIDDAAKPAPETMF